MAQRHGLMIVDRLIQVQWEPPKSMMRTAILSALLAVLPALGFAAQDPPKPKPPAEPATQQKTPPPPDSSPPAGRPAKPVAPPPTGPDPAKLADPVPSRDAKIPGAAPVDAGTYILGAEDGIFVSVWGSPEFSGNHMIRPDGRISISMIGEVMAAGLTPEAFGAVIKERLKKYIVEPDVIVQVLAVNSKRYFIQGEVYKPGEYKLVVPTKVFQALVNAGGFRDFADKKHITIIRGAQRIKYNYTEVLAGKHMEQDIFLQPDDIIVVK